jgi:hypothetical protein
MIYRNHKDNSPNLEWSGFDVARERDSWWAVVSTVMNSWGLIKFAEFLD